MKANSKNNSTFDKIVVVDPGKNTVKVMVFSPNYELIKHFKFPSKSIRKRNFVGLESGSSHQYKIELDGVKHLVGEGVPGGYDFESTKNTVHHKVCIYTAIAKIVETEKERIHLVVGYPSSDFDNVEQRKLFEDNIKSEKAINMIINGEDKTFTITDLALFPEGIGFRPRNLNQNRKVRIVDIGGQNINYRIYDEKGNSLDSYSLDGAGINHLEEKLRKDLRKVIDINKIDINSVDLIEGVRTGSLKEIDNKLLFDYKTTGEFIEATVYDFLQTNMFGALKSNGHDLYRRGDLIIFTGGTSLLLEEYIKEELVNNEDNMYFSTTAQYDNCISYIIRAMVNICKKEDKIKEARLISQKILKQVDNIDSF